MGSAPQDAVRSLIGETLIPYLGTETRGSLAGELAGLARYAESWGTAGEAALARVLGVVMGRRSLTLCFGVPSRLVPNC